MAEVAEDKLAKIQQIETQGPSVEVGAMRLRLLKEMMGARVDQRAEYVVVSGCNAPFRFYHVKSFVDLLERLGVDYSFLSKEFCCGNSYLPKNERSPELEALEPYAVNHEAHNMAAAESLGARALVTFCANCNARYRRHLVNPSLPILYWADLILDKLGGLALETTIDFYEGFHRDQNAILPGAMDPAIGKSLLRRIDGLAYNEIDSDMCCKQKPQDIFAAVRTGLLVTPTSCCYGYLSRTRPRETRLVFLTDILLWALEDENALLGARQRGLVPAIPKAMA